jgi:hypothetical protein
MSLCWVQPALPLPLPLPRCPCLVHQEATLDFFGCAVKAADFSQHLAAMELLAAQVNNLQSESLWLFKQICCWPDSGTVVLHYKCMHATPGFRWPTLAASLSSATPPLSLTSTLVHHHPSQTC